MGKVFHQYCPICKTKAEVSLHGIKGYRYCFSCQLGWVEKLPKNISYDNDYYEGTSSIASKLFNPIGAFFYKIRESFAGSGRKKLWIDVGAGDGGFLKTVDAEKKIGVEISSAGRKIMKKFGLGTLSDQKFLQIANLNADVISYWHVLEHVDDPWKYIRSGKKNLARKGKIIIGIPNSESFELRFFGTYWFHLVPDFHLWHFSPRSIRLLLQKEGFAIDSIDYWSLEHHLTGTLQSFINKSAHSDSVLHRLIKRGLDYKPAFRDVAWSLFWMTIGFPVVVLFWIASSVLKRSGTFIVVASPNRKNS